MKRYGMLKNSLYTFKKVFEYKKIMALYLFLTIVLSVVIPLLAIALPALAIDLVTRQASLTEFVVKVGLFSLGLLVLNSINAYFRTLYGYNCMPARLNHFIVPLCSKMVRTDYVNIEYHDAQIKAQRAGDSVTSNGTGPERIMRASALFVVNILGLIVYASLISTINVWILVLLVGMTGVNLLLSKYVRQYETGKKDDLARIDKKFHYLYINSKSSENGKDIRLYKMEHWFYRVFKELIRSRADINKKIQNRRLLPNLSDSLFLVARDFLAYYLLIQQFLQGAINAGTFTFFIGAITGFSIWMNASVRYYNQMKDANIGVNDYRHFMELENIFNHDAQREEFSGNKAPAIEIRNLSYTYPGKEEPTIRDVSLSIAAGEKIALVGLNGAGKTTLIKLLTGLYPAKSGTILIDGRPFQDFHIDDYYRLFSVIYQDDELLAFNVKQNISCQKDEDTNTAKVKRAIDQAGIRDLIERLPQKEDTYNTKIFETDGVKFSGGEAQKILFAKALYKDAPIVILDEPTSALDPIAESELYEHYNDMMKNKTSIFISHRLASTKFCDRIVFFENGQIVETGSHEELMRKPSKYKELFDIQSHYYKEEKEEEAHA